MSDPGTTVLFTGDADDAAEDPQDFINGIERFFMLKGTFNDQAKVKYFKLNLKARSPASAWFDGLQNTEKDTWDHLEAAFEQRWPPKAVATKTSDEKRADLDATLLTYAELKKKTKVGGIEEYTHVVWANKMEKLARDLPDPTNLLVPSTRKKLPSAINDIIGVRSMTWAQLCAAVRDITGDELEAQLEKERKQTRIEEQIAALTSKRPPDTPSKALGTAFRNLNTGPIPQPQFNIPQPQFYKMPNPGPAAPQSTAYTQSRATYKTPQFQPRATADRLVDVYRFALPIHPNTPEGRTLHQAQVATYMATNGSKNPHETRQYPLSPGTAPAGSGECWTCGYPKHHPSPCEQPQLPALESAWRRIAGTIYSAALREGADIASVHLIDEAYLMTEEEFEASVNSDRIALSLARARMEAQGKGQGSST
jgi:hypothetical protein